MLINENKVHWFKKVKLLIFTSSIYIAISEKNDEILKEIIKICSYNEIVTPKLLSDEFGLNIFIFQRLLDILTDDLKIFKRENKNGEYWYELIDSSFVKTEINKEKSLRLISKKRFTICEKPFLFIKKSYFSERLNTNVDEARYSSIIEKIDRLMKDNNAKKIYNIPQDYLGLNQTEGIKINGFSQGDLKWIDEGFSLFINN
ncbi:MAG: hypothetical protein ACTSRG_27165, partial [Candidatus Helarchaeota archaeon]